MEKIRALVIEAHGVHFKVEYEKEIEIETTNEAGEIEIKKEKKIEVLTTFLAGRMMHNHIRVIIGDMVEVELDPYGGKGRIVKRL